MLIVLTGIDGSGKTTAARAVVAAAREKGEDSLLLRNYAGRQWMTVVSAKYGIRVPPRLADALETVVRTANVLVSHARARSCPGLVVMDRHLHCQLALRRARGLPRGWFLPLLMRMLPKPDLIIHLVVGPEQAHRRISLRGTDTETVEELSAFGAAYRALPEYPDFVALPAQGTPEDVLSALTRTIDTARKRRPTRT
ncbi:MAG: thymidylate kinase [Arthrobacter sp.]|nr:thymidylate kinase [Arthrobacter sp.]